MVRVRKIKLKKKASYWKWNPKIAFLYNVSSLKFSVYSFTNPNHCLRHFAKQGSTLNTWWNNSVIHFTQCKKKVFFLFQNLKMVKKAFPLYFQIRSRYAFLALMKEKLRKNKIAFLHAVNIKSYIVGVNKS